MLGLYREQAGPLSPLQFGDALIFTDTATLLLLGAQDHARDGHLAMLGPAGQPATVALGHAEIDQATGMLTEQLGVNITDAYLRLRAYAFGNDMWLTEVARDIVARRLRLRPDPDTSWDGEA